MPVGAPVECDPRANAVVVRDLAREEDATHRRDTIEVGDVVEVRVEMLQQRLGEYDACRVRREQRAVSGVCRRKHEIQVITTHILSVLWVTSILTRATHGLLFLSGCVF